MPTDLFAVLDGAAANAAPFVVITMPGKPRGKGDQDQRIIIPRPGTKSWANGRRQPFAVRYLDKATEAYMGELAQHAKNAMRRAGKSPIPLGTPIAIRLFAIFPVPKSWSNRDRDAALAGTIFPTGKPDNDNIAKQADAFKGIVWDDDAQVCRTLIVKEYGEKPGIIIEVYLLP